MWIKLEYVDAGEKTIVLPLELANMLEEKAAFIFGRRVEMVNVLWYSKLMYKAHSTVDDSIMVYLSNDLKYNMFIPDTQLYQAKISKNTFYLGPVIGLLLGMRDHYSLKHMNKYTDRLGAYNKVGGLLFAFSPNSVVWDENIADGMYFNIKANQWEYGTFPLPNVIYRRDFHQPQDLIDRLKVVTEEKLFNSHRFSKSELFDIIRKSNKLAANLPETDRIDSFDQLNGFVDRHKKVILKPNNLSRGRGIFILEKREAEYIIEDYRGKQPSEILLSGKDNFLNFYKENEILQEDYLVQKLVKLAKIDSSTFDIRVVMQKISKDTWINSGAECRVAKPKYLITNVSRGGYAMKLDKTLQTAFKDESIVLSLTNQINEFCLDVCKQLDDTGEHYSEFGMDIGVDEDCKIWLIEANVFPSFKGFKSMDYDTYLKIRYMPLLYALSLTEFADGVKEEF